VNEFNYSTGEKSSFPPPQRCFTVGIGEVAIKFIEPKNATPFSNYLAEYQPLTETKKDCRREKQSLVRAMGQLSNQF
jgi:hypothetical protein